MNMRLLFPCLNVLACCLTAAAMTACGDDSGGGEGGAGGGGAASGATTSSSSGGDPSTSTSSSTTSTTSSTSSGGGEGSPVIDDMEDGNGAVLPEGGRQGYWYTYNDETATGTQSPAIAEEFTMSPIEPPREGSSYAAHTSGSGFTTWGAGMGFDLNSSGTVKSPYDGSGFTGITFFARVGTGTTTRVRVSIADKSTAPEGGVCTTCSDHFGKDLVLSDQWQSISIPFSELRQIGFGDAAPALDASALYSIQFQAGADTQFDLWIDDVAFIE